MVESDAPQGAPDPAGHRDEVDDLIRLAATLTPLQVRQLATAAAWRWLPLGLPSTGNVAGARAAAIGAGRRAGRGPALEAAQERARQAALMSPGGISTRSSWASAETALAAVLIGVVGAAISAGVGSSVISIGFVLVALVGGILLLFLESGYVRRLRLAQVVSAMALATVTRDLLEPEAYESLAGPWLSVMRD
jgi:hypothetical protein